MRFFKPMKKRFVALALAVLFVSMIIPSGIAQAAKTTTTVKTATTPITWKSITKVKKGWYGINNTYYDSYYEAHPKVAKKKTDVRLKMTNSKLYVYGAMRDRNKTEYYAKPMKLKFTSKCKFYMYKYSEGPDQYYYRITKSKAKTIINKYKNGGALYRNLGVSGVEDEVQISVLDEMYVKSNGKISKVYLWWKK